MGAGEVLGILEYPDSSIPGNLKSENADIKTGTMGKKLSILIPVYNERETLKEILRRIRNVEVPLEREIILVDDGSTDGTRDLLEKLDDGDVKVVLHERNRGKGAAVRTAIEHATGEILLIQDADLEYDPEDYPILLEPILRGYADVVYGNRFHGGAHRVLYFWHRLGNWVVTAFCNVMTNFILADMEVGYKVFRSEVLKKLNLGASRFGIEVEMTVKLSRMKIRLYEVPIRYHGRTYEEGKKITWRDGIAALWHILRYRFFSRPLRKEEDLGGA